MNYQKKIKGLPNGYSEKDLPQGKNPKYSGSTMSKDQKDMIYTLLEMPGNKPRPKAKA